MFKKQWAWLGALVVISTLVLAACQPRTVIVEKEVKVVETQVVEVEKEVTKIVAGTPVVEKVVETKIVEKEVTPVPTEVPPAVEVDFLYADFAARPFANQLLFQVWQAAVPDAEINWEVMPIGDLMEKVSLLLSANEAPDIFGAQRGVVNQFMEEGVYPLDPLLEVHYYPHLPGDNHQERKCGKMEEPAYQLNPLLEV